jgi:hypothetical protein
MAGEEASRKDTGLLEARQESPVHNPICEKVLTAAETLCSMLPMKRITVDDVLAMKPPCGRYPRERLERLERLIGEGITPLDLMDLRRFRGVPPRDRRWVLLRESVLPAKVLRLFACAIVERLMRRVGWKDERSWAAAAARLAYASVYASRPAAARPVYVSRPAAAAAYFYVVYAADADADATVFAVLRGVVRSQQ